MTAQTILYGYSGFETYQLKLLNSVTDNNSETSLILLEDAVNGVQKGSSVNPYKNYVENNNITVFCLKEDYTARGLKLDAVHEGIQVINYDELIDKIETSKKIISWI